MKHFFTKILHVRTAMMLLLTAVLTLTVQTAWASVTYLDANGVEKTCDNYNSFSSCISGYSTTVNVGATEQTTWYVVDEDLNLLNHPIYMYGNVNLILANGKKMTITDNEENLYYSINLANNSSLNIYSQSLDSNKGQLTITTSQKGISVGNCNLTINGGLISITSTFEGIYVGNGSVTINNGDVTINSTNSNAITNASNLTRNGGTVKMYDYTATHPITNYVDAAGDVQPAVQATVLDFNRNLGATDQTTWYVVNSDLSYDNLLSIYGDVNLILADGKELTVNSPGYSYGIYINNNSSLTIYTQSHGDNKGKMTLSGGTGIRVGNGSLTINGGLISVTSTTGFQAAIDVDSEGSVTLNNGEVTTTGYGAITDMSTFTQNGGLLNGFDGHLDTENTNYLDVNGEQQSATATVIESGLYNWGDKGETSWYVVKNDITLPKGIHIYGNVNLILADSKKLTVNAPGYERGIYISSNSSLTIFTQSNGENKGKLSITGGRNGDGIFVDGSDDSNTSLTINGGEITTTGGETEAAGIMVIEDASVTINGGRVTIKGATNTTGGLKFQDGGTVTLGCNTTSDFVQINGIDNADISGTLGTVQVKSGQTLFDKDGNEYSRTLTAEQQTALSGKKLTLVHGNTVVITESAGGTVTADKYVFVNEETNRTVTLTVSPNANYLFNSLTVTKEGDASTVVSVSGAGNTWTFTMPNYNVTVTTMWTVLFADNGTQNTSFVNSNNNNIINVKLSGRTLYKDGDWNTICLPFEIKKDDLASTPLAGATIMRMDCFDFYTSDGEHTSYKREGSHRTGLESDGTLYLYFITIADKGEMYGATHLVAGMPYIVKWETTASPIEDPVFTGVTIDNSAEAIDNMTQYCADGSVRFKGSYNYMEWAAGTTYTSILMLGTGSALFWPDGSDVTTIGACRAYFELANGQQARQFVLNFDSGETTAVFDLNNNEQIINNNWYTLDGRKLDSKPTQKGVYINNGHKVVIK